MGKHDAVTDVIALTRGRPTKVILERLRDAIETGIYADGDQLPAERQLAETFGAARSTVRKVLDQLEDMKLVTDESEAARIVNYASPNIKT